MGAGAQRWLRDELGALADGARRRTSGVRQGRARRHCRRMAPAGLPGLRRRPGAVHARPPRLARRRADTARDRRPERRVLAATVDGRGRPGDRSLIVFDEFVPVGAAWYRLFTRDDAGFGFIDEQTPELAIAVVPSRRGRGYGHELLSGLLDCARKDGFEAISLSVAKDNPAQHLYESYGFEQVQEDDGAVVMRAPLSAATP